MVVIYSRMFVARGRQLQSLHALCYVIGAYGVGKAYVMVYFLNLDHMVTNKNKSLDFVK